MPPNERSAAPGRFLPDVDNRHLLLYHCETMTAPAKRLHTITSLPEFNVALFALLLNLPWEFLQVPLFEGMSEAPHWDAVKVCVRATLGDALIMLLAFWCVAAYSRSRSWILRPRAPSVALFTATGAAVTIVIERLALSGAWSEGWSYAPQMPIVPGIQVGLAPLAQWIVLPPLVVWLVQRQLASTYPEDAPDSNA